ncbi:hypothetical protein JL193_01495 [Polaribacter batillariae]|uniref:Class IIb bacteriocin, lactobin A/cerein 7B family n=1 Tax=Polaribacter batillariae TaxID=2808900 RepID=A0ABX7SVU4_9FLAO|nr:hypothetical protein [Polaribacter batillariae]QTD38007.1 hypothetical protein JL193_01495 [Polaribacter batillariae]
MNTLELNQMELVNAGECASCGQAVVLGMMGGSIFGGIGSLVVGALIALGPNCLDLQGTNAC